MTDLERITKENSEGQVTVEDGKVVVSAAATFTGSGLLGTKSRRAEQIERAMSDAVLLALAEGHSLNDVETILAYKQWARASMLRSLGESVVLPGRPTPKGATT